MSDAKLRDLERRWRESRDARDEAIYLRARLRSGTLSGDRLALAAYCGHDGARHAMGAIAPLTHERYAPWLEGLRRWEHPVLVRALVDTAAALMPALEPALGPDERRAVARSIDAVEDWLLRPLRRQALIAGATARPLVGVANDLGRKNGARANRLEPVVWTAHDAALACFVATCTSSPLPTRSAIRAVEQAGGPAWEGELVRSLRASIALRALGKRAA